MANNVCIGGQLLLLDLIEKVEPYCKIVNSNTDGIFVKIESEENKIKFYEECDKWCKRTRMTLEYDEYIKCIQKDVNNYIIVDKKGKYKSKGAYVKELKKIDYDLPIVNEALVNYFVKNIPLEETILNCDEFIKFQKIVKVTKLYKHAFHNDKIIKEKVLRVFASNDENDGTIFKVKDGDKYEKISNTPMKAFIYNDNVLNMNCPEKLDKNYYLEVAKERLEQFLNKDNKKGLSSGIKFVSYESLQSITSLVEDNVSFLDILNSGVCSKKEAEILTKLNYFKNYGTMRKLLKFMNYYKLLNGRKQLKKDKIDDLIRFNLKEHKETKTAISEFDVSKLLTDIFETLSEEEDVLDEVLTYELLYYGKIKSDLPKNYIICKVDNTTSWSVKLTSLTNGKSEFFKCEDKDLKKDDIIRIIKFDKIYNQKKQKHYYYLKEYKKLK